MFKTIIITICLSLLAIAPAMALTMDCTDNGDGTFSCSGSMSAVYQGDIGSHNEATGRYFAPAGEVNYPVAPNMFQNQPEETYQTHMTIEDMLEYDVYGLTTQEQMNILDGTGFFDDRRIMVRPKIDPSKVKKEDRLPLDAPMSVVYEKVDGYKSVGTIVVLSDSKGSISQDVFAEVQVQAHKLGGEKMHVKKKGFQRVMRNGSNGIGFTWTGSAIAGNEASATTGVMGFGKAWGDVSLYDHPFITVHVLKKK